MVLRPCFTEQRSRTLQDTRQQVKVQTPSSCSHSRTAKTICQARVNQYWRCSDPVGNAFRERNGGWWKTSSISSCVGLARKRRKPRKARKGNESAEANTRSAEARGSTRKRQMISSQVGLLILITAQKGCGNLCKHSKKPAGGLGAAPLMMFDEVTIQQMVHPQIPETLSKCFRRPSFP